jgi:hypothetical protein
MKKQLNQQLIRLNTLADSNDDDEMSSSSSLSIDGGSDSDHSSKTTNMMRENERRIRNLSESYLNRFLLVGQQMQASPIHHRCGQPLTHTFGQSVY